MQRSPTASGLEKEGQLWLLSFVLSILIVLAVFLAVGLMSLHSLLVQKKSTRAVSPREQVVIVLAPAAAAAPTLVVTPPEMAEAEKTKPRYTRTSADQASAPPEKADFIGDRDTTATSDALPIAGAPAMPSQAGRDLPNRQIETTESRAQQGNLDNNAIAQKQSQPTPPAPMPAQPSPPADPLTTAIPDREKPSTPLLNQGDQTIERTAVPEQEIKPTVAQKTPSPEEQKPDTAPAELPKPKQDPNEPGFRGNQEKTKITGSLSRKGRSALNVANTAMGRYQAALSRAVEAEWHKNCTKYRDLIAPGILTVRFVIAPEGGVRSISVVEMVDAGEVQKGFTLGAIRQAKIPPIPADLKAELEGEPIELIYNFYF